VTGGNYAYLHLGGGVRTPTSLGARATNLRTGLGGVAGRAVSSGDSLPIAPSAALPSQVLPPALYLARRVIRVLWGPQAQIFPEAERRRFLETSFRISRQLDRMGIRLETEADPMEAEGALTGVSDAISLGDVQVTGDGRLAVLMADRQPTGGYPRIATVITADLPAMAQIQPGQTVQFQVVALDAAVAALSDWRTACLRLSETLVPAFRDPSDIPDLLSYQLTGGATAGDHLPWEEGP
jgi:allophanate hydrolase